MSVDAQIRPCAGPGARRWGAIPHRRLLDAVATAVAADRMPRVEAATVTHLLRPVPWQRRTGLVSLVSTAYPALARRIATVIDDEFPGVYVATTPPARGRDERDQFDVLVPATNADEVSDWLDRLWQAAAGQVGPHARPGNRAATARTMWRAALLVANGSRRRSQIRVRVPDPRALTALTEAGEALGLTVAQHLRRGNSYFVTVDDPAQSVQLLRIVGAGPHAEAWVRDAA
ncbi:hypothetical protein [Micromonospora sp. NBC_01813]|uniref:hypothetical protein n=1 Tax=Micromonospora sp. NBC_01813 TaxID=2975988 RepID=UPI002DDADC6C|nr:hypothetical protein [Micromonospora sp. NBC_01813]WSA10309.1 hypothetical protein OG958_05810 [Micromonospora sp. NBC_01813]